MSRSLMRMLPVLLLLALALALVPFSGVPPVVAQDTGSISGTVYFDTDMDGQRDAGEPPAPGRTVELRGVQNYDLPFSEVSAIDGSYRFIGLSPDEYYYVLLHTDSRTPCATYSHSGVPGNGDSTGINIGVLGDGTGRVSGALIDDLNENGVYDRSEPGWKGWPISIGGGPEEGVGGCWVTTTTGPHGEFEFAGLLGGRYEIGYDAPATLAETSWEQTFPTVPDEAYPELQLPDNSVDLTEATEVRDLKVGVHFVTGAAAINVSTFRDIDLDEIRDHGELLLDCSSAAWLFDLYRQVPSVGLLWVNVLHIPCQNGVFHIAGLVPGTYDVRFHTWCTTPDQAGPPSHPNEPTNRRVTLEKGKDMGSVEFGVCPQSGTDTPLPIPTPQMVPPSIDYGDERSRNLALPDGGAGGAPSDGSLAGPAAALGVAGALAVCGAVLTRRRQARAQRAHRPASE